MKATAASDVVLKRIEFALSSLHFTIWLPIIVTAAVGVLAATFSISGLDLAWKMAITIITVAVFGAFTEVLLVRVHLRQEALWELYTCIVLHAPDVDKLQHDELVKLLGKVADIQRSWSLRQKPYGRAALKLIDECINQAHARNGKDSSVAS